MCPRSGLRLEVGRPRAYGGIRGVVLAIKAFGWSCARRYHKVPDISVRSLSFGDVTDFSAELEKARQKIGAAHIANLIVIADGAEWIWNIVADRFKQAFAIGHFWHAADHEIMEGSLSRCAQGIAGGGETV
jgi:hypothetical protein